MHSRRPLQYSVRLSTSLVLQNERQPGLQDWAGFKLHLNTQPPKKKHFSNNARLSGKNGAAPGPCRGRDVRAVQQGVSRLWRREFAGAGGSGLSGERHGSISKGSREDWDAVVKDAHGRQTTQELPVPLSFMIRRARQAQVQLMSVSSLPLNNARQGFFSPLALHNAKKELLPVCRLRLAWRPPCASYTTAS